LKPQPSGNHQSPANGAVAATLIHLINEIHCIKVLKTVLAVNISHYFIGSCFSMGVDQVFFDPSD
jgi:hypothetical protein